MSVILGALSLRERGTVIELEDAGVVVKERKLLFRWKSNHSRSTNSQSLSSAIPFRK
jgi:hypothetical protein